MVLLCVFLSFVFVHVLLGEPGGLGCIADGIACARAVYGALLAVC